MNQKKCPKCGETNPAEAVMCWACYTPLSGGATVNIGLGGGGAAAVAPTAIATDDVTEKKPVQPWQMGAIGVALLLVLGIGAKTMMGGGSTSDEGVPTTYPQGSVPSSGVVGGVTAPALPLPPSPQAPVGVPAVAPDAKFQVVAAPNPEATWSIMAIVPAEQNVSPVRAASIARMAKTLSNTVKPTHIYVFADRDSGQEFSSFQRQRRSEILTPEDHASLKNLWARCPARYEFNGGKERVDYPSRNPNGWWNRRG